MLSNKKQVGKLDHNIVDNIQKSQEAFQEVKNRKSVVGKLDSKIAENIMQCQ